MNKFIKSASLAIVSAIAFGAVAPAFAQDFVDSDPGCRRIVSNLGGPDQPRAVAGLNNNQVPFYSDANDIYDGESPLFVESIGERIILSFPQEQVFVNDPSDQNGFGTTMIAVRANNGAKVWMPLHDSALAGGRDGAKSFSTMSKSNLAFCSVQGMW